MNRTWTFLAVVFLAGSIGLEAQTPERRRAQKLMKDGNFKEAFEAYEQRLAVDGNPDAADDLHDAYQCLQSLGDLGKLDTLLDAVTARYAGDWRLLARASTIYATIVHYGVMTDGVFVRGYHRGGASYLNAEERDRVRSLQLLEQAIALHPKDVRSEAIGLFYTEAAQRFKSPRAAWQLQMLTDLTVLPELEEGRFSASRHVRGRQRSGAPVDAEGRPVFFARSETWETAKNDGERWRFLLGRAAAYDPERAGNSAYQYAEFLHQQFGVQTLRSGFGSWFARQAENEGEVDEAIWSLHTLKDEETLCRLATGVRRVVLPDDANHLKWMRRIIDEPQYASHAEHAMRWVARMYENRRQYDKAARVWKEAIKRFGAGRDQWRRRALEQIEDSWGKFDGTLGFPAGDPASLGFVFRNGESVSLRAYEVKVEALLQGVKKFLRDNPSDVYREDIRLERIGHQLIRESWMKYVGREVARWEEGLQPRANHWDRRIELKTPLTKAGAYLLRATMPSGNESNIIVWLHDTAIVKKPLHDQAFYYVADAVTGKPVAGANVEFFGWRRERLEKKRFLSRRRYDVVTKQFAEFTGGNGQILLSKEKVKGYNLLAIARTPEGRLAYHGFSGTWRDRRHDADYKQTKVLFVTDRPVYRPEQTVKMHAWVRHAQYDQTDVSQFANQPFQLVLSDPQGEKILDKTVETDAFGGVSETFELPKNAPLGVYSWQFEGLGHHGGQQFRVEEYKKPEFEVTVEAPTEAVALGDVVKAKVEAKYYFGAPVTKATVHYKVLRREDNGQWYAPMPWDWFYGSGYWWFASDYEWYPGWRNWGCRRPHAPWWPRGSAPPELVLEQEVAIGPDGTVPIEIDTALTKAIHGDKDHRYEITVEVRDESRRTIVGSGKVSVARDPYRVNVWVDRGHYRAGETIKAQACAHWR